MRILVLGHTGMLGNCVHSFFSKICDVDTISYRYPEEQFLDYIKNYDGDFIINCIGVIPQRGMDDYSVNISLPIFLDSFSMSRIIHPGTDCETDLDMYGISKKFASDYILNFGKRTKIIKTSIIGIEKGTSNSLLSWVLSHNDGDNIPGFSNSMWNGVTSLEWSKNCYNLIKNWNLYPKQSIINSECISKYDLIHRIVDVFNKDNLVLKVENDGKNKCLNGVFVGDITKQLIEIKNFYRI